MNRAISVGAIVEADREIYRYAYSNVLFALFTWGLFLIIGSIFGQFTGSLFFLAFYIPLRQFAGGFHQNSKRLCLVSSIIMFVVLFVLAASPSILAGLLVVLAVLAAPAAFVLFVFAPQADEHKPISKNEYRVFQKRVRVILTVELCLHVGMWAFGVAGNLRYFALMATILAAGMVLAKIIQARFAKKAKNKMDL